MIDGLIHPSRLNGEVKLAIYGRAVSQRICRAHRPLTTTPGLAGALDTSRIAPA